MASFPPQVGHGCRVLLLGTAPSVRSLAMGQSYAHPANLFWDFMAELYGVPREWAYARRVAGLHARGVGIWDVLAHCERRGSLDSGIIAASEIPNDIPRLLVAHPGIRTIGLNGARAQQIFARRIAPLLPAAVHRPVHLIALPSTSPANASMSRAAKLERWRQLLAAAPPL